MYIKTEVAEESRDILDHKTTVAVSFTKLRLAQNAEPWSRERKHLEATGEGGISCCTSRAASSDISMTEGAAAPAPAAAAEPAPAPGAGPRRKPRRKRNAGKKNEQSQKNKNKGKKSSNNNNSGPPPPPQIKITVRNIQNSEKFGTVKSVLEGLVSKLMEACVEKKANNQYSIELDRAAVRHLITEEEKIEERRQRLLREKAKREEESKEDGENPAGDPNGEEEKSEGEKIKEESDDVEMEDAEETKEDDNKLDVIVAPKTESGLPTITARPSYVVPPRKTKRRGERGGTAYVLLIGPKIEKKTELPPPCQPEEKGSNEKEKTADEEGGQVADVDTAESKETPTPLSVSEKVINYPQELAKGRLLLSNAIKALIELVTEDTKSQEFAFSGCIVERSMNGKTWKIFPHNSGRPDRREGTIENSADFKQWLEATTNQKEELKARPKPVPGGGMAAATTSADEVLEEDGQPVSSLVQHLRAKKLDAKRKKSQKKKKKEENKKAGEATDDKKKKRNEKKNRKNNNAAANAKKTDAATAAAAAAKKAKRKKKLAAKKKEKAKAAAAAAAAGTKPPTALLKPQATAT